MSAPITISKNGFIIVYWFHPHPFKFVWYQPTPSQGGLLRDFITQPSFIVTPDEPLKSQFNYDESVIRFSDKIFETIQILMSENQYCAAALMASEFYESFTPLDREFRQTGKHALSIPLWISVLNLVRNWENRNQGVKIHIGTPLYFLSVGYFLTHNIDPALIYLVKSIGGDIELSKHCPQLGYPETEPAYRTVCLIDHSGNFMYPFIVVPLRDQLKDAIFKYNQQFGDQSRIKRIQQLDSKFLRKCDTDGVKIELIKQLFVLELIKLLQLRHIELEVESNFFKMLLNRLFSLTLVIDKLLFSRYPPPDVQRKNKYEEPEMFLCIFHSLDPCRKYLLDPFVRRSASLANSS